MRRVLVVVPLPLDDDAIALRSQQSSEVRLADDVELDYRAVKVGPAMFDSHHDDLLADLGIFAAAAAAQEEGYDAVCMDTTGDSAVPALRSVLDIPVIGPGLSSYLMATLLGKKFSVLTLWEPWNAVYRRQVIEYELSHRFASIRAIDVEPDLSELLSGNEEELFPALAAAGRLAIEDGADTIVLGSTTMHASAAYLQRELEIPIINPGPVAYKMIEAVLDLGLTHSRRAYRKPDVPQVDLLRALVEAAAD